MRFLLAGFSHKTAPVHVRERMAFSEAEIPAALANLVDRDAIDEALIVSTCNRVEVLAAAESADLGIARIRDFLGRWRDLEPELVERYLYSRSDREAVLHLFRVAASLDSMVVGEPQILGQVRDAYRLGVEAGTVGSALELLLQRAFAVAKRVRNETSVGASAVSISYVAVELGRKIFDSLRGKSILLVGAGEMAELAARHFADAGAGQMIVANRTIERAAELADRFGATVVDFEALHDHLSEADVVLCSTSASEYVIGPDHLRHALERRRNRPFFLIDISVPRQIDPAAAELENVFLFDMDDLHRVVESNVREREREASVAEAIVADEVVSFFTGLGARDIGPTVAELKDHLNEVALSEYRRLRRKLGPLTPEQESAIVSVLLPSIVNKISHPMITHLRDSVRDDENGQEHISIWRRIFRLGGDRE